MHLKQAKVDADVNSDSGGPPPPKSFRISVHCSTIVIMQIRAGLRLNDPTDYSQESEKRITKNMIKIY